MNETIDSKTGEIIPVQQTSVMESMIRAEVDIAISTARRYPRNIVLFKESVARVISDPIIAAGCGYLVPIDDGIEGPSVRLAEIMAQLWGNLSVATRTLEVGERFIRIQAVVKDLESNFQTSMEIERPITKANGKRYSDSVIKSTIMGAQSIGFRNVVFKAIPREYVEFFYAKAMQIAAQDPDALLETRGKWMSFWEGRGVSRERVLAKFKVTALKNISSEDVSAMQRYATALKDGDTTLDEIFPPEQGPEDELDTLQPDDWGDIVNDALKKSKLRKAEKDSILRSGIKDQKTAEKMLAIINIAIANKTAGKKPKASEGASASADKDSADKKSEQTGDGVPSSDDDQGSLI